MARIAVRPKCPSCNNELKPLSSREAYDMDKGQYKESIFQCVNFLCNNRRWFTSEGVDIRSENGEDS